MSHKPIHIHNLRLSFPHKTCFAEFTIQIGHGSRIAVIGRNGSGKSSLLKMLLGTCEPTGGGIALPGDAVLGYVPQVIEAHGELSGGQRFNAALTEALSLNPNVLLLDEPTNHLDRRNRASLMRMLRAYAGTLIAVTHDPELLRTCLDTLWHIDSGKIRVFTGGYDDYMEETRRQRRSVEQELACLAREKKAMHQALIKEQESVAKRRASGRKKMADKRWTKSVGDLKAMKAEKSQGNKMKAIDEKKRELTGRLAELKLPGVIVPKFTLPSGDAGKRTLVTITEGAVGYQPGRPILENISLAVAPAGRVAITGDNGSGKTTLVRAILGDEIVIRSGEWHVPGRDKIGYLDQHYGTLPPDNTVIETIAELLPASPNAEVRRHLNDFLFRKNEEVHARVGRLSGGERARLSLAQIAARTPQLLILDEITNNLDLETREHTVEILAAFPAALIVISHDRDFLDRIGVVDEYRLAGF